MVERWLIEYWWILAALLYVILLVVLALASHRRGTFERTWPKITLVLTCVIIVLIPTMHAPGSYVNAVIAVSNLWVLFRSTFNTAKSSESVDR